jgi:hypothetical protein
MSDFKKVFNNFFQLIVTNLATVIRRSFFRKVSIIFFEKISVLAVEPYRFFSNVDKAFAYSYKIQAQINNRWLNCQYTDLFKKYNAHLPKKTSSYNSCQICYNIANLCLSI